MRIIPEQRKDRERPLSELKAGDIFVYYEEPDALWLKGYGKAYNVDMCCCVNLGTGWFLEFDPSTYVTPKNASVIRED